MQFPFNFAYIVKKDIFVEKPQHENYNLSKGNLPYGTTLTCKIGIKLNISDTPTYFLHEAVTIPTGKIQYLNI